MSVSSSFQTLKMSADSLPGEDTLTTPSYPWNTSSELALFKTLLVHKPAGINKHFSMALVSEALSTQLGLDITSEAIWAKLRTMFDLAAVDDREEVIPFPLEEKEFSLPRRDYSSLIAEKQKDILKDRALGKSKGGLTRMSTDMGSEHSKKEKGEAAKAGKANDQKNIDKADDQSKPASKRHATRSTPSSTPAKKRK